MWGCGGCGGCGAARAARACDIVGRAGQCDGDRAGREHARHTDPGRHRGQPFHAAATEHPRRDRPVGWVDRHQLPFLRRRPVLAFWARLLCSCNSEDARPSAGSTLAFFSIASEPSAVPAAAAPHQVGEMRLRPQCQAPAPPARATAHAAMRSDRRRSFRLSGRAVARAPRPALKGMRGIERDLRALREPHMNFAREARCHRGRASDPRKTRSSHVT